MRRELASWTLALFALGASAASCGYSAGFGNPYDIRSVRILAVEDRSYRRSIAERLTRQIGRDLTRFTGLVPGGAHADAELQVTVFEAPGRSVVEGNRGVIVEGAVGLRARVRLVLQNGRIAHEREHVDWAEYRATVGEQRRLAFDESIAEMSRKILLGIDTGFVTPRDPGQDPDRDPRAETRGRRPERRSAEDLDKGTRKPRR